MNMGSASACSACCGFLVCSPSDGMYAVLITVQHMFSDRFVCYIATLVQVLQESCGMHSPVWRYDTAVGYCYKYAYIFMKESRFGFGLIMHACRAHQHGHIFTASHFASIAGAQLQSFTIRFLICTSNSKEIYGLCNDKA